ncbi:MAG: DUF308 domain-containing protein [Prevotella sp.]|nr:DUF308 domain-containing protein [Prevotella sp.]MBQ8702359.1 DUF308 domain-containing protein [Prevotella sp.]MBQ9652296.1 DUF308 domain-containing protein [Prevotella sp.]
MKIIKSGIFRALCAIVVGALLAMYREEMVEWLAKIIGILFFVSGLISVVSYFVERRHMEQLVSSEDGSISSLTPTFPIVGLGSLVMGVVLAVMPTTFITTMMYILAALLILGAIGQYASLIGARQFCTFSFIFWIFPTITLLAGIFIIANPMDSASLPFRIIGWAMMFYGVIEIINSIKIHSAKKAFQKIEEAKRAAEEQAAREAEDADVEEIKEEPVLEEQAQDISQEEQPSGTTSTTSTDNPLYILTDNTDSL